MLRVPSGVEGPEDVIMLRTPTVLSKWPGPSENESRPTTWQYRINEIP